MTTFTVYILLLHITVRDVDIARIDIMTFSQMMELTILN